MSSVDRPAGPAAAAPPVLEVSGLRVRTPRTTLLHDMGFTLGAGERLGIIGESGSGKSLTVLSAMGLLPEGLTAEGSIRLRGVEHDLVGAGEAQMAAVRGARLGMVFQEPMTALNPLMRVGRQVAEAIALHGPAEERGRAAEAAVEMLGRVRLPDPTASARAYPHQLSGGQRQRVMLAMALANDPDVLICDEPTTALDVTVQAQMLDLIREGAAARDAALLFITHDLAVVAEVCERVLVLHEGRVVERGTVDEVFTAPQHAYTRRLLAASDLEADGRGERLRGVGAAPDGDAGEPLVAVRGLERTYRRPRQSLRRPGPEIPALRRVDLDIRAGQRFGIVGESGSGKSTLIRLIAGLDRPTAGSVRFAGTEIVGRRERDLAFLRRDLQMVFQDPMGSLDPRMRVEDVVAEPLVAQHVAAPERRRRVAELLEAVGLPADAASRYPHQFSGGQRQRISIARALSVRPKVLVADEAVSALDVSVRAQVLDLIADLVEQYGLTLIFVSHDLSVVRHVCDTVAVMRHGRVVETGPTEQVYRQPSDPYTRALLAAVPTLERALGERDRPRSEEVLGG
ncbi:ABC transporter ATP-binding protein [Patulibacter sp. SYSU D01012]|uniref:dipeptide ABC transporter ATP-binding protein n=1 Tax=Patulibacter sp. SYSU D01012 TaxID=2817381 RepID=UPI001B304518|nr:ABC transporter ATP-binding protein [Patulibacter sp. SYSU D01012]